MLLPRSGCFINLPNFAHYGTASRQKAPTGKNLTPLTDETDIAKVDNIYSSDKKTARLSVTTMMSYVAVRIVLPYYD